MPPGWDAAYGLFLKGKAPLVWSYVTSEAYHRALGSTQYRAVILREGQPLQLEGAVIVRDAADRELAGKFLEFLLSSDVQNQVAGTNWMWPAKKSASVPESFKALPRGTHPLFIQGSDAQPALKDWSEAIHP